MESTSEALLFAAASPKPSLRRFVLYALRPPRLRTHDARDSRGATQTELFFDLVIALPWGALVDTEVSKTYHPIAVAAIFNGWLGWAFFNTRYDTDSATARFSAVLAMTGFTAMGFGVRCVAVSTSELNCDDDQFYPVTALFILGYVAVRAVLWLNYAAVYCALPARGTSDRITVRGLLTGFGSALACCGAAVAMTGSHNQDGRLALFVCALGLDYLTPFLLIPFQPSIRIHHMLGRFGRFLLICVNSTVLVPLLQSARLEDDDSVSLFSPMIALWPPFCLVQLHSAPIGGLASSRERVEHFHRSYEGTTLRKLRIYAFFYSHLPLSLLISALFTRMRPWNQLSGPAGDKVLWAGVLLCLAAQHVLVSVHDNAKRALSRAATAMLLLALALADRCWAPEAVDPANAPPAAPPTAALDWNELDWSLCNPAVSSILLCGVLLLDVFVDAFLSFQEAEKKAAVEGAAAEAVDAAALSCQGRAARLLDPAARGDSGLLDGMLARASQQSLRCETPEALANELEEYEQE